MIVLGSCEVSGCTNSVQYSCGTNEKYKYCREHRDGTDVGSKNMRKRKRGTSD